MDATPLLNSDLLNLVVEANGTLLPSFNMSIQFVLATSPIPNNAENVCVFLEENSGEFTQSEGIINSTSSNSNATSCRTSRSGSFGVLVRQTGMHEPKAHTPKEIVAFCILMTSLIFLTASIIIFFISGKRFFKVEANILYFNYAIALILGMSIFIIGFDKSEWKPGCAVVAFMLHYTWLSVFSWSFAISLFMVYILFFGILNRRRIWWLMMIIGWGLPLPFVIPTAVVGVLGNTYAPNGMYCFPSYTDGLIWGFLGPFIFLIIASTIGGVFAAIKIFLTMRNQRKEKPQHLLMAKNMALTILALLPILSVPWIIILVNALHPNPWIEWAAIIITAPAGLVFFFIVVLRNTQVQEVMCKRKPKDNQPLKQMKMPETLLPMCTLPSRANCHRTGRDGPASSSNRVKKDGKGSPDNDQATTSAPERMNCSSSPREI